MKNTLENWQKLREICEGMLQGGTLQTSWRSHWIDFAPKDQIYLNQEYINDYRVKPAPKKRPIRTDELPPIVWIKFADGYTWLLVRAIEPRRIYLKSTTPYTIDDLISIGAVWSPDRKTENSFEVEE